MDYKYGQLSNVEGQLISHNNTNADEKKGSNHCLYPAQRRNVLPKNKNIYEHEESSADRVLIKTAGNALQAVSRQTLLQEHLVSVSVPFNCKEGDEIWVRMPSNQHGDKSNSDNNNSHDTMISAIVPPGCFHGHTFFVKVPSPVEAVKSASQAPVIAVMGVPVDDYDLEGKNHNDQATIDTNVMASQEVVVHGQDVVVIHELELKDTTATNKIL